MDVRGLLRSALARLDFEDVREHADAYDRETLSTIAAVRPFTMTSPARIAATCDAIRYVTSNRIPGAVVECGVWAGGSMMAVARTLVSLGSTDRDLYLFDTFDGMTEPTDADSDHTGSLASVQMATTRKDRDPVWAYSPLDRVVENLRSTGYPADRVHFVKGPVEATLPSTETGSIAVLRLDTDWYDSTAHELKHLTPRVSAGGVLLIDDYGHWQGARRAVDEWIASHPRPVFLARTDYTGRSAVLS